jgi:hypothetical protein
MFLFSVQSFSCSSYRLALNQQRKEDEQRRLREEEERRIREELERREEEERQKRGK